MAEVALSSWYSVTYCCVKGCGVPIVLPASVDRRFKADHSRRFYCYNGHSQHYIGETDAEKLRRELDAANQRLATAQKRTEWAERDAQLAKADAKTARRGANIARGKLKAQSQRVKNGVCPCCNRTFQNLLRHMATKHPEFSK